MVLNAGVPCGSAWVGVPRRTLCVPTEFHAENKVFTPLGVPFAFPCTEEMVNHAEESRERRGVRAGLPSSGSGSSRPTPAANDEESYQNESVNVAFFFQIGLVPREVSAFEV